MPRQIIDTQSSRPAYIRRRVMTWIVAVIALVLVALVAFELLKSHATALGVVAPIPGKFAARVNLGPIPHDRRGHAA